MKLSQIIKYDELIDSLSINETEKTINKGYRYSYEQSGTQL
jgi:hypothetical protein